MNPLDLLDPGERRRLNGLALLSVTVGVLNGTVIGLVGLGFGRAWIGEDATGLLVAYLLVFGFALFCYRRQRLAASSLVFDVLCRLRIRLADRLARLELREIETLDTAQVMHCLATDSRLLADSVVALTAFLIVLSVAGFTLIFFIWLSQIVFWLSVLVCLCALVILTATHARLNRAERVAEEQGRAGYAAAADLIDGFKELKLNQGRRAAFFAQSLIPAMRGLQSARASAGLWMSGNYIAIEAAVLLLAVAVILGLPMLAENAHHLTINAGILALSLPAAYVLELPVVFRAWAALGRIHALDRDLAAREAPGPAASGPVAGVAAAAPAEAPSLGVGLNFEKVFFRYVDEDGRPGFGVGPLSFDIVPGQLHFLVGGNGSGKSTVLKLAMGLYPPVAGRILVDGEAVDETARRRLAAAVFADSHLFDRLYGWRDADPGRVNDLLDKLGIAGKTRYENGRFTNLDLSTGQKKRVAMVAALIEDKPIYVFDEWAADQDPEFREHFYRQLLPELTERGKTVICATHDDRYFDLAQHLFQFDKGWLVDEWHVTALPKRPGR
ncbi:MAG: ATP-binding cassette domain-containing protein [Azospirillum sp.]|nr:ATP-binding cassette domain-containing protein [Azospirillum sp.]